ncbi:hypothetical protein DAPPUDRAFT_108358 [Daphnia pulex]|uniref:FLYWCH-type domain-containing protein n=1 Tax=Daphnia pulex TaxID=6669 RepID=E9GZY0_DAPPU|nr:hypothetical protein DAPPUDRAFT_108358 [Daphnia pulex]|eukprot:EFX74897.1 hypothetical protein DAPPUDRAFT_108358 [Daphnia pulex]
MNCLSCSKFTSREQKLQCKWQHRRCVTWHAFHIEGYRRIKRCYIFKCSNCTLQNIENKLPSEARATNCISSENSVVSEETTTEKVNSSPSQRPSNLFLQSTPFMSNIDPERPKSRSSSNKFTIVEGGSTKKSYMLIDGFGFRYGVKRKNQAGVTWRCNFRGKKKACTTTVKEVNGVFTEGAAAHFP